MRLRRLPLPSRPALDVALLLLFALSFPGSGLASLLADPTPSLPGVDVQAPGQEALTDTTGRVAPPDTTAQGLKRMTVDDYALWRTVGNASLSPDGRWVTYSYTRREVDDSLFIRPLEGGDPHVALRGSDPSFSADSRWVAYFVNPPDSSGTNARQSAAAPSGASARGGRGGGSGPRALVLLS
ncbi:MAG: hypothetical protein PVJ04_14560, partial [Gemmatimonadota bacterium]